MSNNGSQFAESKLPVSSQLSGQPRQQSSTFDVHANTRSLDKSAKQEFGVHAGFRSSATGEMRSAQVVPTAVGAKTDNVDTLGVGVKSLSVGSGDSGGQSLNEKLASACIHVVEVQSDKAVFDLSQLPELSKYTPRLNSFVSRLPPNDMCAKVRGVLQSIAGVDLRPATDKLKLKGVCYRGGSRANFLITPYQSQGEVVVVCEKQSGCPVLFNHLFRLLLTQLGDSIVSQGVGPQPPVFACPPDFQSETPFVLDPSLSHRANSEFLDVQIEAAASLVELFQGESRGRVVGAADQVELFCLVEKFLSSDSEELSRLGSVLLKNLLESNSASAERMSKTLLARMFQMLESPATYLSRDSKRQVETALVCIGNSKQAFLSPEQRAVLDKQVLDKRQRVDAAAVPPPLSLSLSR